MAHIAEKDLWAEHDGIRVYGRLRVPDAAAPLPAVICSPFFSGDHETAGEWAAPLAEAGIVTCAIDFFGDGSLFLVEALGHLAGHVNILARTSATGAWLFLGADCAHDRRLLTGEREMSYREDPKTGRARCAHADKDAAVAHIARVRSLLGVAGVQVLLAHDWEWYEKNKGGSAFLPGTIPALM